MYVSGLSVNDDRDTVRPAINVDLTKVLFTSAPVNGKQGSGSLKEIADYAGTEWKLTV